jgi:RHS repeat-associated protein
LDLGTVLQATASVPNLHLDWTTLPAGSNRYVVRRKEIVDFQDKSFDGSVVIATLDDPTREYDDATLQDGKNYFYRVLSRVFSDGLFFYHDDHLGTPVAMTDAAGAFVWKTEHRPFGGIYSLPLALLENNLRFPGQYADAETGEYYNGFRDYQPLAGRYSEPDPLGIPGGLNLYVYVYNDPLNLMDPLGLLSCYTSIPESLSRFQHVYDRWFENPRLGLGQQDGAKYWGPVGNVINCVSFGRRGSSCVAWAVGLVEALKPFNTQCCRASEKQRWVPLPHTTVGIECRSDTCKDDWRIVERYDPFWRL